MRRTRILVTAGPASHDPATIRALLDAGADAFRLNFSHATAAEHAATCRLIRDAAKAIGREVAVVQDLGGPKIRTGPLASPLTLAEGDPLVIEQGDFTGGPGRVSCRFEALFTSVQPGHRLLVDDGHLELEVTAVAPGRLTTRVVTGGVLDSHKGINVPDVAIRTTALTPKDVQDLRAGIAMGVDLVALSFVQSADDIVAARTEAAAAGAPDLPIIAKIEKPQAVDHVDEILKVADGLMVARGDLGVELPLERLPAVQRLLVLAARRRGVPVIVATQVLESMRVEPRPTRAEVTDAAHAVDERVDAIMLSGETAVGRYPVRAVATLDAIVREAEKMPGETRLVPDAEAWTQHGRALCEAAVTLADRAQAAAIVAVTEAGHTARMLASLRPAARILAATPSRETAARLSLVWGVTPVVTDEASLDAVRGVLATRALVPSGAAVVFVAMRPALGRDGSNFVHIERM
jgi:pyruvate kinase